MPAKKAKSMHTNGDAISIAEYLKGLATHTKIDRSTMFDFLAESLKAKQIKEALDLKRKQHKATSDKLRKAFEVAKEAVEADTTDSKELQAAKTAAEKAFATQFREYEDWLIDLATADSGIEFRTFPISKVPATHTDTEVEIEQAGGLKTVTYQWLTVQLVSLEILTNDTSTSPTQLPQ